MRLPRLRVAGGETTELEEQMATPSPLVVKETAHSVSISMIPPASADPVK
jgi:hypothetical protein